jgi:hypothetical protein
MGIDLFIVVGILVGELSYLFTLSVAMVCPAVLLGTFFQTVEHQLLDLWQFF